MPGIKDVAERAGLSIATVSRALSGKGNVSPRSRERAQHRRRRAWLRPVLPGLQPGLRRNHNVGLVVPSVHRWFFSSVVEGVSATLLDAGYDLTLYNVSEGRERRHSVLNDFLLRKRVDAVIAVSLELSEAEIDQLLAIHRPIVGIGGPLPGASTIRINDSGIAEAAARHLIQLGHSKIAHMTGDAPTSRTSAFPAHARRGSRRPCGTPGWWSGRNGRSPPISRSRAPMPAPVSCSAARRTSHRRLCRLGRDGHRHHSCSQGFRPAGAAGPLGHRHRRP